MTGERLYELLNGGDWACAWAERETLRDVCRQLSVALEPPLAHAAEAIGQAAERDMGSATRAWARLATLLRAGRHEDIEGRIVATRARSGGESAHEALTAEILARLE